MLNSINDATKEDIGAVVDDKALATGGGLNRRDKGCLHSALAFMSEGARNWISS